MIYTLNTEESPLPHQQLQVKQHAFSLLYVKKRQYKIWGQIVTSERILLLVECFPEALGMVPLPSSPSWEILVIESTQLEVKKKLSKIPSL